MADQENLELDEVLEKITFYCFDEARKIIEAGEECVPFTCVVSGEQMFVESYPGEDVTMCRKNAEANVKSSSSFSSCYAFCYDGFLMTDEGQLDAILVECAQRDMESSYVIGLLYKKEGDQLQFAETPAFIQAGETFYDAAAVQAAEEQERVLGADADEMSAAQKAINSHLNIGIDEE